jgi:hypothetical protein
MTSSLWFVCFQALIVYPKRGSDAHSAPLAILGPATAQSYDPAYPVCLHVHDVGKLLPMQLNVAASV